MTGFTKEQTNPDGKEIDAIGTKEKVEHGQLCYVSMRMNFSNNSLWK
jgi:hypothetical protein